MTTSTMAALKASLRTELQARAGLSGVQVTYGDIGDGGRWESIRLGEVETGAQNPAAMRSGTQRRRESYILHVYVEVIGKPTPEANEARAIVLAGELEDLVASDPKVNDVPNLLFCYVEGFEMETNEVAGEGPRTLIDITLQCEGNLL